MLAIPSIGEVIVRLVGQYEDGRRPGAVTHLLERMEERGAIGQAQVQENGVEVLTGQAIESVGKPIHGRYHGGAPVGPEAILFDFEQGVTEKLLVLKRIFDDQEPECFGIPHSG